MKDFFRWSSVLGGLNAETSVFELPLVFKARSFLRAVAVVASLG